MNGISSWVQFYRSEAPSIQRELDTNNIDKDGSDEQTKANTANSDPPDYSSGEDKKEAAPAATTEIASEPESPPKTPPKKDPLSDFIPFAVGFTPVLLIVLFSSWTFLLGFLFGMDLKRPFLTLQG